MSGSTPVLNNLASPPYRNSLSSSLKDRLKRCGRYHSSPSPGLSKKRCLDDNQQLKTSFQTPGKKLCSSLEIDKSVENDSGISEASISLTPSCLSATCTPSKSVKSDNLLSPKTVPVKWNNDSAQELFTTPVGKKSNSLRRSKLNLSRTPTPSPSSNLRDDIVSVNNTSSDSGTDNDVKQKLLIAVQEKEEKLRKLKMVKMYRKKNDLSKLEELIEKWRTVSQDAVQDLHRMLPEPKPTLHELIQHLQIDQSLIRYNPDEDSFD